MKPYFDKKYIYINNLEVQYVKKITIKNINSFFWDEYKILITFFIKI